MFKLSLQYTFRLCVLQNTDSPGEHMHIATSNSDMSQHDASQSDMLQVEPPSKIDTGVAGHKFFCRLGVKNVKKSHLIRNCRDDDKLNLV